MNSEMEKKKREKKRRSLTDVQEKIAKHLNARPCSQ